MTNQMRLRYYFMKTGDPLVAHIDHHFASQYIHRAEIRLTDEVATDLVLGEHVEYDAG